MPANPVDVVVVGAGAAGGALGWRLTELGAKVVCLEQGDWVNPADYPSQRLDFESSLFRGPFHVDPNVRRRSEDYPITKAGTHPPNVLMFNAVGGSTIHWQAMHFRFHPSDFRARTLDGVADDWPISYRELEPYYDMNDRMMGVSGLAGDPAYPLRSPRPTPPLPIGSYGEIAVRGLERLGWHWWVGENAIISEAYDGRPPCQLHGKCTMGCPMGAKASTDVTYWPKAIARGAELKTRARAREILIDRSGRARGVLYYDRAGALNELLARVVVVCCNGIGTPRLLLNSRSALFPDGLGNSQGLVGRFLMVHPGRAVTGVFSEPNDGHIGPNGIPLYSQEFYENDPRRGYARGYTLVLGRNTGPLGEFVFGFPPLPWGREHHGAMRRRFPHSVKIVVLADDLPEPHNRVDLDSSLRDSNGLPAARATYSASENSLAMLGHGAARAREWLEAAGAEEIQDSPRVWNWAHYMGTARMGSDPKRSVVDQHHRVHGVPNVYVVDGSSFVTGAGVNPTSTIGALALRAADGIWDRRSEW